MPIGGGAFKAPRTVTKRLHRLEAMSSLWSLRRTRSSLAVVCFLRSTEVFKPLRNLASIFQSRRRSLRDLFEHV